MKGLIPGKALWMLALFALISIGWLLTRPAPIQVPVSENEQPAQSLKGQNQTGQAFQVISTNSPGGTHSPESDNQKTPEELIAEAEQILSSSEAIMRQYPISDEPLSDEQKVKAQQELAQIQKTIEELEQQLQ